ncbi:MAG TPA: hypothetical protein VGL77_17930 [Armatimonadota bacterium]
MTEAVYGFRNDLPGVFLLVLLLPSLLVLLFLPIHLSAQRAQVAICFRDIEARVPSGCQVKAALFTR